MADIWLERSFKVSAARLFEVVTSHEMLVQWWGHEGWTFRDEVLDLSRTGPWHAAMTSDDGNHFKHSGQVTHVDPPLSVGFTLGWHDSDDKRGVESHVTFRVQEIAGGAKLIIEHRELPSADIAARYEQGWGEPLDRLANLLT